MVNRLEPLRLTDFLRPVLIPQSQGRKKGVLSRLVQGGLILFRQAGSFDSLRTFLSAGIAVAGTDALCICMGLCHSRSVPDLVCFLPCQFSVKDSLLTQGGEGKIGLGKCQPASRLFPFLLPFLVGLNAFLYVGWVCRFGLLGEGDFIPNGGLGGSILLGQLQGSKRLRCFCSRC